MFNIFKTEQFQNIFTKKGKNKDDIKKPIARLNNILIKSEQEYRILHIQTNRYHLSKKDQDLTKPK